MHVHVDEPGCDDRVARVDHDFAGKRFEMLADFADESAGEAQVAQRVEASRRIDQPAAGDQQAVNHGSARVRPLTMKSSTAMRIATP